MAKQWGIGAFIVLLAVAMAVLYDFYRASADQESPRQRSLSKVNVMAPQRQTIRDVITSVGTLQARDSVELTAEVSARVVELGFRQGERVSQGQLLVRLDDRQARADLRVAEARFADASRQYDRARSLRSNNSISQSQADELRTAREVAEADQAAARSRLDNHRIEAPFEGVVGLTSVSIGAYLTPGTTIASLDATRRMELSFSVPERYLSQISQGLMVEGVTSSYPDEAFPGTLASLGTRISALSRTLPVKALIDNPDGRLRPGQFMSVRLTLRKREALVVPEQAILTRGDNKYLFTVEDGVARRLEVILGSREPGLVEVVEGVDADSRVVITGQERLSSGDRVEVVEDDDAIPGSSLADGRT